jgi:hypothetical protein
VASEVGLGGVGSGGRWWRSIYQPGAKRGRRRRGWRRLLVGEVAIRRGATGARAGWAEARWEEGSGRLERKKEWAVAGPEVTGKKSFPNKI